MTKLVDFPIDNHWVKSRRGPKNHIDPRRPYAFHIEEERGVNGDIEKVITVFLSNQECPFRCLMCDLWKNTTDATVAPGDIPEQISYAIDRLPEANVIKLYNSGNFFDVNAIPVVDYPSIARLVDGFDRVIIENHPNLINAHTFRFNEMLGPTLEIAMGLETSHPEVLEKLNKNMTLNDFEKAVSKLSKHEIQCRSFILLKPPFLDELEGVHWAKQSIEFAFEVGVQCAIIIPTRYGNDALNELGELGYFSPPNIRSLEQVIEHGIGLNAGNVFADLWDIEQFSNCSKCLPTRKNRLSQMNLHQSTLPQVTCSCN